MRLLLFASSSLRVGSTSRVTTLQHVGRIRLLSSTPRRSSAISDTIESMVSKFKKAVEDNHSDQYAGTTERGLRMLMFGKPGSGKGTLSARLVQEFDIAFVSTGDVLRKEIMAKSEVGRKAEAVVATGGLVSDELMLEVVMAELDRLKGKSWIIDGFPRTLQQGELLDNVLNKENRPLNMIVHLNVPDAVIMGRIAARWVHLPSGRVYNTTYSAPKTPGKDDITGEALSKRPDDTPETFTKRLKAYYESTAPLLEYFSQTYPESLHSLSGSSSDEVGSFSFTSGRSESDNTSPLNNTPQHQTKSSPSIPDLHTKLDLDQLWPGLVSLIEPFGLGRKRGSGAERVEADKVREAADDLKEPRD